MTDVQRYQLHLGDCLEVMRTMEDNACDSIVCDPPYALSFMGAAFDTFHEDGVSDNVAFQRAMTPIFAEALRVAKPGAHLVAFGGTRTYHRLTCAIEDAGWEIRDSLMWITGQSMPKGLNIGKAIEKSQLAEKPISEEAALAAQRWEGWNSQLKPAFEPIVLARKPLDGNIVDNVLKWDVGGINIDECRVPTDTPITIHSPARKTLLDSGHKDLGTWQETKGRYPANLIHDGSDEVLACFPDGGTTAAPRPVNANRDGEQSSESRYTKNGNTNFAMKPGMRRPPTSPARFFYCAKASRSERGEFNTHITVKPLALMRWLVTLVAPKDSVVLDPFMGSGSTGIAALQCGCRFVGIEKEPEYMKIAKQRIATALDEPIQHDDRDGPAGTADCPDASDKSPSTPTIQQGELGL